MGDAENITNVLRSISSLDKESIMNSMYPRVYARKKYNEDTKINNKVNSIFNP